ncbi:MAG: FkbM family methyltransferase [Spirochaetales bacterium]|nr:FkbM family methyltransferase [Spirochaetales bacterium]
MKSYKRLPGGIVRINPPGYPCPLFIRDKTTDVPQYKAIIEEGEYDFTPRRPPEVILDAGANIGLSTVYFANRYPGAKIIALEPEGGNYKMLVKNTENYPQVRAIQAALWDRVTEIDLFDTGLGNDGFMAAPGGAGDELLTPWAARRHSVQTITVEKIMKDCQIGGIDILKMDIEGAEREVFNNSREWMGRVRAIIVELHERMKPGCQRSFYNNTNGFDQEWQHGEDFYLTRENYIRPLERPLNLE